MSILIELWIIVSVYFTILLVEEHIVDNKLSLTVLELLFYVSWAAWANFVGLYLFFIKNGKIKESSPFHYDNWMAFFDPYIKKFANFLTFTIYDPKK